MFTTFPAVKMVFEARHTAANMFQAIKLHGAHNRDQRERFGEWEVLSFLIEF